VKTVVSHVTNMAKIYRASDSVKCTVPLLTDGTSLHRGEGNTKQKNRVASSLHRNVRKPLQQYPPHRKQETCYHAMWQNKI